MDLLQGKVKTTYLRYLSAAFGSAMISSIYGVVDMAMVGQYQGPTGTAALAVVAPVWNIVYSLGLLTGIGGSVLFSTARGMRGAGQEENTWFSAAFWETALLALVSWAAIAFFDAPLLRLFGAEETLLPLARAYLLPVKFAVPLFLFNQMLSAFLRNDGSPGRATAAVLAGGIFNVAGDYLFVFTFGLGVMGAGLATALGALITLLIQLTHFFSGKNTLRLTRSAGVLRRMKKITVMGFSTFFIDIAMGVLTMLFNRQIMRYSGADSLAVYGVIVNVSTIVQCCAYSVGQAAQPLLSTSFGAGAAGRIRETLKYAMVTAALFGLAWMALTEAAPTLFIRVFMAPTDAVLAIAPFILRSYALSFLLLPLNIFSTYYFQALMRPGASFFVSVTRGVVLSGALILALPAWAGPAAIWFAMPITELLVAAGVLALMVRYTRAL